MVKVTVSYENEKDKFRIIELLSKGSKIIDIKPKDPKRTGKFTKVYVEIE